MGTNPINIKLKKNHAHYYLEYTFNRRYHDGICREYDDGQLYVGHLFSSRNSKNESNIPILNVFHRTWFERWNEKL